MYDYFQRNVKILARCYANETGCPNSERNMFARACAMRLSQRIFELTNKTGDKNQLALAVKYAEEKMGATSGKVRSVTVSGESARKGFAAADGIGLNLQANSKSQGSARISQTLRLQ
jgi:hypothetical protein